MRFRKRKLTPKYEKLARLTANMLNEFYKNEDIENLEEYFNNNIVFDVISDEFIIIKDCKKNIMYFARRIHKNLHIYKATEYSYYIFKKYKRG